MTLFCHLLCVLSVSRLRAAKSTPPASFKFKPKWGLFLRPHSDGLLEGDSLVVFGQETRDFKGRSPWIGPQWLCVQQHRHSDARACSSSLLIGLYQKMQNPHPSLHITCCGLISHVFTWIGLVTDNLFIRPSRDSSPFLYVFHEYGRQYRLRSRD